MPGMKKTMGEYKRGTLKSGSGKKVTSRKQATAIAMSEAGKSKGRARFGGQMKRKAPSEDQLWGAAKPVPKKQTAKSRAKEATRAKNKVMAERGARTHGNANTPGFAYGRKTK